MKTEAMGMTAVRSTASALPEHQPIDRYESKQEFERFATQLEALMKEVFGPEPAVRSAAAPPPPPPKELPKEPTGASPFAMGTRDLVRLIEDALDRAMPRCTRAGRSVECSSGSGSTGSSSSRAR